MAAKFVAVLALVCASGASVVPAAVGRAGDYTSFAYDVADPNTGDYKSQVETRAGGVVQGQYSLLDADGTRRTVDYSADDVSGFNAVVRKDPVALAAPVVSAPVVAAPAVVAARTVAAPAVYSAVAPATYSAVAPAAYSAVAPATYSAVAPATYSAVAPATYAVAPAAYATSRTVAAPAVYAASAPVITRTVASPAVYTASAPVYARAYSAPSVYAGSYYAGTPYTYGAVASPISYAHGTPVAW